MGGRSQVEGKGISPEGPRKDRDGHEERIFSRVRRTLIGYSLIEDGDLVLVGLSGGKDSLSLAYILSRIAASGTPCFSVFASTVVWREHPLPAEALSRLDAFMEGLGIGFSAIEADFPEKGREARSCYSCSRERKRLLFEEAKRLKAASVAIGHTRDDAASTALMALLGRGRIETLEPSREFFDGSARIIRPLIDVPGRSVATLAERKSFPVVANPCPEAGRDARSRLEPELKRLEELYPGAKARLARQGRRGKGAVGP